MRGGRNMGVEVDTFPNGSSLEIKGKKNTQLLES